MKTFILSPKIVHEKGAIQYLKYMDLGKVLIVTDEFMVKFNIVKKITKVLDIKSTGYEIFSKVQPNPTVDLVVKGLQIILNFNPDTIIAVGGGSSIDTAKGMMLFFDNLIKKKDIKDVQNPYFIAVPTTSGTGSEVTSYSVITNSENGMKMAFNEDIMFPDLAVLDSDFTSTVPPKVTADTGIDVLTHALEAFTSNMSCDYTDILAEGAIKSVFNYLLIAYTNEEDALAREKMHNASCMAGIAFTNAALGINHSMAHALGGKFKISHGRANAVLLPYVIEYNSEIDEYYEELENSCAKKYAYISKILGLPCSSIREGVMSLVKAIKVLNKKLDIPITIQGLGINEKEFNKVLDEMSKLAINDICTEGNPKKADKNSIKKIFIKAYSN
ncbi:iron-containing alcohol dehydrogenase [Clostridium sp. D2Q-14]|uniref:1-propanol dehydrogenase PduQ n=1 Tax=Anaeromonas gelatinilytica TaxID=2683194 RepID=UPI00193B7B3F|nr:1-propanol dehydrogenase PduQ [Anaeromonas gelatinilytica]MBS4534552.1 iron-containing alcohol dehydrogenase [Anaeromonas gelatinilytica]